MRIRHTVQYSVRAMNKNGARAAGGSGLFKAPFTLSAGALRAGVLLVVLLAALSGCGISSSVSLFPAIVTDTNQGFIQIEHNTSNQMREFKGYNVYYKLYKSGTTATQNADRNYITDSTRPPLESTLTTRNFRPLYKFSTSDVLEAQQKPHIVPDLQNLAQSYTVYIDYSAANSVYSPLRTQGAEVLADDDYVYTAGGGDRYYNMLMVIYNGGSVQKRLFLKRDTASPQKSFFQYPGQQYSASDADIKAMIGSSYANGDQLEIIFAVIPYGIDFTAASITYGAITMSKANRLEYDRRPPAAAGP